MSIQSTALFQSSTIAANSPRNGTTTPIRLPIFSTVDMPVPCAEAVAVVMRLKVSALQAS